MPFFPCPNDTPPFFLKLLRLNADASRHTYSFYSPPKKSLIQGNNSAPRCRLCLGLSDMDDKSHQAYPMAGYSEQRSSWFCMSKLSPFAICY